MDGTKIGLLGYSTATGSIAALSKEGDGANDLATQGEGAEEGADGRAERLHRASDERLR